MSYKKFFLSVSLLFLILLSPLGARQFVQCSVRVDGTKTFKVDSIFPDKKVYLEVAGLASAMGWRTTPISQGQSILIDGKTFNDLRDYERRAYVSAKEIGDQFGYDVKVERSGLVVDFWSKGHQATGAAAPNYGLKVLKQEKTTSPNPEYQMYKLTLELKNPSSAPGRVKSKGFVLSDDRGNKHKCEGNFEVGVPAKDTVKVERVYFTLPRMASPKELQLLDDKGQTLGSARL